jgi:hypothetical protein
MVVSLASKVAPRLTHPEVPFALPLAVRPGTMTHMGMQVTAMRFGTLGVAAAVLAGLAGCSAHRDVGALSGRLLEVGGPSLSQSAHGGRPLTGTVTIMGPSGSQDIRVGPDGGFAVELPPGRYSLKGSPVSGPDCSVSDTFEVVAGSHVSIDAQCSVF